MKHSINSDLIQQARIFKGLSRAALAKQTGLTTISIYKIESKQTKCPHPKNVKAICDVLDINITQVYKWDGNEYDLDNSKKSC